MSEEGEGEVSSYFKGFVSITGTLGFLLNFWGMIRAWKTFKLSLAPYLILFLGTSFSCFALLGTLIMFGHIFIFDNRNVFTCNFYVGLNSVASLSGSIILSVLSIIRYKIATGGSQDQNKSHIVMVVVASIVITVHGTMLFAVSGYYHVPNFPVAEYCIHGPKASRTSPKFMVGFAVPNFLSLFISALHDCRTYLFIRKHAFGILDTNPMHASQNTSNRERERKRMLLELPLKATILSSSLSLPYIFMGVISFKYSLDLETQGYLAFSASLLTVSLKFPAVAAIIFRKNETNKARSQEEEREHKRQMELQHARQLNEERRRKASSSKMDPSNISGNDEKSKESQQTGKLNEILLVVPVEKVVVKNSQKNLI